jgi:hypothetical protein
MDLLRVWKDAGEADAMLPDRDGFETAYSEMRWSDIRDLRSYGP